MTGIIIYLYGTCILILNILSIVDTKNIRKMEARVDLLESKVDTLIKEYRELYFNTIRREEK